MKRKNLIGMKFGRLTVIELSYDKSNRIKYKCLCDCGKETVVASSNLVRGNTKSCGCIRIENIVSINRKHGEKSTRLYRTWMSMRSRCNNPNNKEYHRYGGRGISCCEEWNEFIPFRNWALAAGYEDSLSIDRIDNDGDYCPSNCRWVTRDVQSSNTSKNVYITYNSETKTMSEWARFLQIDYKRFHRAIKGYGYTMDKAIEYAKKK